MDFYLGGRRYRLSVSGTAEQAETICAEARRRYEEIRSAMPQADACETLLVALLNALDETERRRKVYELCELRSVLMQDALNHCLHRSERGRASRSSGRGGATSARSADAGVFDSDERAADASAMDVPHGRFAPDAFFEGSADEGPFAHSRSDGKGETELDEASDDEKGSVAGDAAASNDDEDRLIDLFAYAEALYAEERAARREDGSI